VYDTEGKRQSELRAFVLSLKEVGMLPFQSEAAPLERYGHNLTELAKRGTFSPLTDQDVPVRNMLQILRRKNKCNPVLLDFDETRRWKVVAEAIRRMAAGEAPDPLPTWQVVALDYEALCANPPVSIGGLGEVKDTPLERLRSIFAAIHQATGPIVLFVDHFHRLVGGEESPLDASTLLKPALHRHEIQLIGACTLEQYRQDIKRNAPIQRCCQPLFTPEAEQDYGGIGSI